MKEGWQAIVRYDADFGGVAIWLVNQTVGKREVVRPIDLTITSELKPYLEAPEPTFRLSGHQAEQFLQSLAEGLVLSGFKPDELKVANETLRATKYHLEDMRKLVFEERVDEKPI